MSKFRCRICGGAEYHSIFQWRIPLAAEVTDKQADAKRYLIEPAVCKICGHVQLIEALDIDMYGNYLYTPSYSDEFQNYITTFIDSVECLGTGKRAVEIGSSNGFLIKKMQERGYDVLGVEPSETLVEEARLNGVATMHMCFGNDDSIRSIKEWGTPDVVVMRHVMEHLDDLHGIIEAVGSILDKGIFVIEVPWLLRIIKEKQFYAFFHEHLSYFSMTSIKRLVEAHGFRIIDIRENNLEGGSIAVYVCKGEWAPVNLDKISFYLELENKWCSIDRIIDFSNEADEQISRIRKQVAAEKQEGKRIAAWGAGQRGVTLINICEWNVADIDYIIDANRNYWWKYIPGANVQIVPPEWLEEHWVDAIIIMATGYADEIIAQNKKYIKQGGKFLLLETMS